MDSTESINENQLKPLRCTLIGQLLSMEVFPQPYVPLSPPLIQHLLLSLFISAETRSKKFPNHPPGNAVTRFRALFIEGRDLTVVHRSTSTMSWRGHGPKAFLGIPHLLRLTQGHVDPAA